MEKATSFQKCLVLAWAPTSGTLVGHFAIRHPSSSIILLIITSKMWENLKRIKYQEVAREGPEAYYLWRWSRKSGSWKFGEVDSQSHQFQGNLWSKLHEYWVLSVWTNSLKQIVVLTFASRTSLSLSCGPLEEPGCRIGNSLTCSAKMMGVQGRWLKSSLLYDLGVDGGTIVFRKWGFLFEHDILGGVGRNIESNIFDQSEICSALGVNVSQNDLSCFSVIMIKLFVDIERQT